MRVILPDPKSPRQFKPVHEVSNQEPVLVVSTEKIVLGPFECKLVWSQVISQQTNEYRFRNVMIRESVVHTKCPFVSEDTLTFGGDVGKVFQAVKNKTANEHIIVQSKTVFSKAKSSTFVFGPVGIEQHSVACLCASR